jgi:hypothetical protein
MKYRYTLLSVSVLDTEKLKVVERNRFLDIIIKRLEAKKKV